MWGLEELVFYLGVLILGLWGVLVFRSQFQVSGNGFYFTENLYWDS